jgi:thermitase
MAKKGKAPDQSADPLTPCSVELPVPDDCCVTPCGPPWIPEKPCIAWYETKVLQVPLEAKQTKSGGIAEFAPLRSYIEFRITFLHRLCLLGKQHGPLLFTVTLLPGEKVTLYHSERYRQVTSIQERFSVQTTFMQYVSLVHQARVTGTLDTLSDKLTSVSGSASASAGIDIGIASIGGGASVAASTTDHNVVQTSTVADVFGQSVLQSSQLTQAERSVVVSNYEDRETADITSRVIQNNNACRAVTYFVRTILELYGFSTAVSAISYRIVAPGVPADWHLLDDVAWLPPAVQAAIKAAMKLLPKIGDIVEAPLPIPIPTDGTVYDAELAHCCSCEPEREAAMMLDLEKQKADAMKACLEAQLIELEVKRRSLLLDQGQLAPFDPPLVQAPPP